MVPSCFFHVNDGGGREAEAEKNVLEHEFPQGERWCKMLEIRP